MTFLVLFVYVCWPYDAQPARHWSGWYPAEMNLEMGRLVAFTDSPVRLPINEGESVFITDGTSLSPGLNRLVAEFELVGNQESEVELRLRSDLDADQQEQLAIHSGPWTIHEHHPQAWPAHYSENLARKERIAAEFFLIIDPLVSLSTGIASGAWVWSLSCAAIILLVCVLIPRGFCGYLWPTWDTDRSLRLVRR